MLSRIPKTALRQEAHEKFPKYQLVFQLFLLLTQRYSFYTNEKKYDTIIRLRKRQAEQKISGFSEGTARNRRRVYKR
jgi:hypothetical protein